MHGRDEMIPLLPLLILTRVEDRMSSMRGRITSRARPRRITQSLGKRADRLRLGMTSQYCAPPVVGVISPFCAMKPPAL